MNPSVLEAQPERPLATSAPAPAPAIILDTNAVLDAWLFQDVYMTQAAVAIIRQEVRWLATPRMRQELAHTLSLPVLQPWQPDVQALLARFDDNAVVCAEPQRTPLRAMWCSDSDDQVFIDLALAQGARWLLTKDRALLKLARKARALGLQVVPPARWKLKD